MVLQVAHSAVERVERKGPFGPGPENEGRTYPNGRHGRKGGVRSLGFLSPKILVLRAHRSWKSLPTFIALLMSSSAPRGVARISASKAEAWGSHRAKSIA